MSRPSRIVRQTTTGGLVLIQRQFAKYTPFKTLFEDLSKKAFGISILAVWLIMIFRALLGGSSFLQLQKDWNDDPVNGILVGYRKAITHRLLARNIHRILPDNSRKMVIGTVKSLYDKSYITLRRTAIDSSEIVVSGSKYKKIGSIKKKGKYYSGYRLSIIFDLDSKVPIAYILTSLNVHDSKILISLLKFVKSEFGIYPKELAIDRGYYGVDFFKFFIDNGIKFFIPAKSFSAYKNKVAVLSKSDFQYNKKSKLYFKEDELILDKVGKLRCLFVFTKGFEEWMPCDNGNNHLWAILTNDTKKSSLNVIRLYKERWQIEVFFKGIKQQLGLQLLPGRDYRIIQMHVATVLLSYILLVSLVLEERSENENISIYIKTWINKFIKLILSIILRGDYVFLEFQEKWVSLDPSIEEHLNGGIFM